MTGRARQQLELVGERQPETVTLAKRLALTVRARPALVRAARLDAELEAVTESDLWYSTLVSSAGPLGVALDPAVSDLLRDELEDDERERDWELVCEHHAGLPWSIRLEEKINYLTAGGGDAGEIEELLAAALDELHDMRETDERAALGIARWLLAALGRLPAAARGTPAAVAAGVAAGAHLDGRVGDLGEVTGEPREKWLPKLLGGLGTTELPVRLQPTSIVLGGRAESAFPLRVPRTDPLVLTVETTAATEEIRLRAGEERAIFAMGRVVLRTIAGDATTLEPVAVGRIRSDGRDVAPACAVGHFKVVTVNGLGEYGGALTFAPIFGTPVACTQERARAGAVGYLGLLSPVTPAPLGTPAEGARWRLADGRPGGGVIRDVTDDYIYLTVDIPFEREPGTAVALEKPWGAVFGILVASSGVLARAAPVDEGALKAPEPSAPAAPEPVSADHEPPPPPRTVGELTPEDFGIKLDPLLGDRYLPRVADEALDAALNAARLGTSRRIVVAGPSGAGKSRSLLEAIKRALPAALPVVAHRGIDDVDGLIRDWYSAHGEGPGATSVIWVGDLADAKAVDELFSAWPWDPGIFIVATFDDEGQDPSLDDRVVRFRRGLTAVESDQAWRMLGPELALDPEDPWNGDELAARERAVARAQEEGDPGRHAQALWGLGQALRSRGREDDAWGVLGDSLTLQRRFATGYNERRLFADRLLELARANSEDGLPGRAVELAEEAVSVRRVFAAEAPRELVHALIHLADFLDEAGRSNEAVVRAHEAIDHARESGDELAQAQAFEALSRVEDGERAVEAAQEAVALFGNLLRNDPERRAGPLLQSMANLADRLEASGRMDEAIMRSSQAVATANELQASPRQRVELQMDFADRLRRARQFDRAIEVAEDALVVARVAREKRAQALEVAIACYEAAGVPSGARALTQELIEVLRELGDKEALERVQDRLEDFGATAEQSPSRVDEPLGTWTGTHVMAGVSAIGGTVVLYSDRLEFHPINFPSGEPAKPDVIRLVDIESIEVRNRASLRRPPTARLHLTGGLRFDLGIVASRLSPTFRPANNKAFDDFLSWMPRPKDEPDE
jgi:tetratricopeptide (TPR) repeat protein